MSYAAISIFLFFFTNFLVICDVLLSEQQHGEDGAGRQRVTLKLSSEMPEVVVQF